MTLSNVLGKNKNYILLNVFGSKHILVMKYAQFMECYTGNILYKNYSKNVAWELVPGAFLFLKNPLQKGIRGSLVVTIYSPWDWAKLVSNWEQNLFYTKS